MTYNSINSYLDEQQSDNQPVSTLDSWVYDDLHCRDITSTSCKGLLSRHLVGRFQNFFWNSCNLMQQTLRQGRADEPIRAMLRFIAGSLNVASGNMPWRGLLLWKWSVNGCWMESATLWRLVCHAQPVLSVAEFSPGLVSSSPPPLKNEVITR